MILANKVVYCVLRVEWPTDYSVQAADGQSVARELGLTLRTSAPAFRIGVEYRRCDQLERLLDQHRT